MQPFSYLLHCSPRNLDILLYPFASRYNKEWPRQLSKEISLKKKFVLPFEARACSLLAYSDESLEHGFFAYKVQFPSLPDPENFALESRLTWSSGLGSLYRYSEPVEAHKHSSQAFFELPDGCREVVIEPVKWKKSSSPALSLIHISEPTRPY